MLEGGGAVASDVLLARLQGHAERLIAVLVSRHANDSAWHLTLKLLTGGHEGGVGASIAQGDAEALAAPDGDVRAELTGGAE